MTLFINCTLGYGVHVQIMQDCCIGTYMARWFAASMPPSPKSGISPHVIPPQPPHPLLLLPYPSIPQQPQCVMLPSLCPCVFIVPHPLMSENMWCLVFCSQVSLLRMMASRFTHVPAKDMNSSFLWLHSIPWYIYMPHFL